MGEAAEEIGGDGFLIMKPGWDLNRQYISTITDGLVPELQRLGLTRTEYTQSTLRGRSLRGDSQRLKAEGTGDLRPATNRH